MLSKSYQTLVAFFAIATIGVALVPQLSVQLAPTQSGHSLLVNYNWYGAAPEVIERQATARLEGVFSTLDGVKRISSTSSYNKGSIEIELENNVDADATRFEAASLVRQVYSQLPRELSYPQIQLNTPSTEESFKPLLTLQLSGPTSPSILRIYAEEKLKPLLASTQDLGNVEVFGGTKVEWVLTYDADALKALQIDEDALKRAIERHFKRSQLGQIQLGPGRTVRIGLDNQVHASRTDISEDDRSLLWKQIPLLKKGETLIYLGDVITASRQDATESQFYRINGQTAINLVLSASNGANQLRVAEEVRHQIDLIKLPSNYKIKISYDSTEYITQNLSKIGIQTGVAVIILILFIAIVTRSIRYIVLILSSMILTILLSSLVFVLLHVEMHLYSLAALTTSLGIVVDNVIIMIDHYRHYRDTKVFTALLGATLTTCAGLVIIWFLPGENWHALSDFAIVMGITLFASLFVSFWFVPAAIEQFWNPNALIRLTKKKKRVFLLRSLWIEKQYSRLIEGLLRFRGTMVLSGLFLFGLPIFLIPDRLEDSYSLAPLINPLLESDWYIEEFKPLVNKTLGGTMRLFVDFVFEGSESEEIEKTALYIIAELPSQSTPEQMNDVLKRFENSLFQYTKIDQYITQITSGQQGSIVIYFKKPYEDGIFPFQLKNRMITLSSQFSGIEWSILGIGQGFNQNISGDDTPKLRLEMFGYDYQQLDKQVTFLAEQLGKKPRVKLINVNESPGMFQHKDLYEVELKTDINRLALKGLSSLALYDRLSVYNARSQSDMSIYINGEYEAMKIISSQAKTIDFWMLQKQSLNIGLTNLKLNDLAIVARKKVSPEVYKENQQYRRVISFEYQGNRNLGEKFLISEINAFRVTLPLGYTIKPLNQHWHEEDARSPYVLIGMTIILIFAVCSVTFENFRQPFALICLIPISYVGIFVAFYLCESNFDQGGYASFILLTGNAVCAGILIVAEMNRLLKSYHMSTKAAYIKAFRHKIGPVMLTVFTTIFGMFPFLIYDREPFWYTLGIGTIGGLLMSLIAILIYLPILLIPYDSAKLSSVNP